MNDQEEQMQASRNSNSYLVIRQIFAYVLTAFITYLLMGFNSSWLFGIQFSPLYATLLSVVFMRFGIPLAILGYALQQAGVSFPLFQLNVQ